VFIDAKSPSHTVGLEQMKPCPSIGEIRSYSHHPTRWAWNNVEAVELEVETPDESPSHTVGSELGRKGVSGARGPIQVSIPHSGLRTLV